MKTINVEDLPEPLTKALADFIQKLRLQLRAKAEHRERIELPAWPGKVIGRLTREEIYEKVK